MPAPEINVRLTADGVQDVIGAFKRVQAEAKETKEKVSLLGQAWEQAGELIPVVTIGVAVEKLVELSKEALNNAFAISKMAEKTGASIGVLSTLAVVTDDVGIEQEQLGNALVRLARSQEQAAGGNAKSAKAFRDLGISMDEVKKKNPGEMLIEIAQHLQTNIPEGAQRAAIAMQLFSKGGAEIIPLLDKIGTAGGFEEAEAQARRFGLYLSDEMVAQARQAKEAMNDLRDATEGFAMQFMAGFVPELGKAVGDFTTTVTGSGADAFQTFGKIVGNVVRGVVGAFLVGGNLIAAIVATIGFQIDALKDEAKVLWQVAERLDKNDFKGAWQSFKAGTASVGETFAAQREGIWSGFGDAVRKAFAEEPAKPVVKPSGRGGGGSGSGEDPEKARKEFEKQVAARSAYEDAIAQGELEKQKARDQLAEAQDKALYDAGLESLAEYYDARRDRINAAADEEHAILLGKLNSQEAAVAQLMGKTQGFVDDLVKQGPKAVEAAAGTDVEALKLLKEVAATRAKMDTDEIGRQTKLAENDAARLAAQKQAGIQMLSDRQRLAQLEGDTAAANKAALDRELQETEELLIKLGIAADKRAAILSRARVNAEARSSLGVLGQQGSDAFASLQTSEADIQNKAAAGAISQLDAEVQLYNLDKQRLPALQAIATSMQEVVDNTEAQLLFLEPATDEYAAQEQLVANLQKQTDDYTKKVEALATSLKTTKSFSVELSNQLTSQGASAFVSFFDAIDTGTKSASDAFKDLGKSFESIITHMIDQMIVYYSLMALLGWLAPNSNLFSSLSKSGPFSGLTGHASGGYTGGSAPNRVAGLVHGQEFVMNASATRRWGLPLLQAMNAGVGSVATGAAYSGMSGSGGGGAGDPGALIQVNVDTGGQPAQTTRREGPGGTSIIDIVVGQVAADIAGGGRVGQSIQSTFGVARKGVLRG